MSMKKELTMKAAAEIFKLASRINIKPKDIIGMGGDVIKMGKSLFNTKVNPKLTEFIGKKGEIPTKILENIKIHLRSLKNASETQVELFKINLKDIVNAKELKHIQTSPGLGDLWPKQLQKIKEKVNKEFALKRFKEAAEKSKMPVTGVKQPATSVREQAAEAFKGWKPTVIKGGKDGLATGGIANHFRERVGFSRAGMVAASNPLLRGTTGSSQILKAPRGYTGMQAILALENLPEPSFLKKNEDESKEDIVERIETIKKEPDQEPPEDPNDKLLESIKLADELRKLKKHEKRIPVKGEKNIARVGNRFEVRISRGGEDFEERFDTLELAIKFRDKIAQIPSKAGKHMIGKVGELHPTHGKYDEEGGSHNIREILTDFITQGKTTYTTQDVLDLVDKNLLKDERAVKQTLQKIKKEPAFKDLEFVSDTGGPMEFSAEAVQLVLDNYGKLTNESMAELIFPGVNKTTAIARVKRIRRELVAEGKLEEMKPGDVPTEVSDTFDLSPENIKRQIFQKERVDTIKELGSKTYEGELFKFKKKIQDVLGLKKIQTKGDREIDQIDTGHRSSIKQLKALNEKITPADIGPDFYKANRLGIKKYKEGVKTLEGILKRDFYPDQTRIFKKAKKFLDEGKTIPVEIRKEIVKINDRILEAVDKADLKGRINAITLDPFTLKVKRGENVARTVGFGLTETAFEDVEIGGEEDAVNKMNYALQILAEAVSAGLIDEKEGTAKLDEFFNTRLLKKKGGPVLFASGGLTGVDQYILNRYK